jgi:hypothetical protein
MSYATTLRFLLDATNIEEADDGNTTHFGGTYELDGLEKRGHGDDRSDSYHSDIAVRVMLQVGCEWPELYTDERFDDLFNVEVDVMSVIHEIVDDGPLGTIVVHRKDDGDFLVTRE